MTFEGHASCGPDYWRVLKEAVKVNTGVYCKVGIFRNFRNFRKKFRKLPPSDFFVKNVQTIGFTEQQRTLELNDKGNHNALR